MTKKLTDQVIVITGASAGIGAATAVAAARAGMHVVLAARREDKLRQVAEQVRATGRQALVVPCDVAMDGDVRRLVDQTTAQFGRIDVMFANAGYGFMAAIETLGDAEHRAMFEVNYWGTVRCIRAALGVMKKRKSGHIVVTSSIVGRVGLPFYAHYSATKAAQDALATGLRLEVEEYGIDVSTVYPIGTKTEFFDVSAKMAGRDGISENTPAIFMQTPEHVARRIMQCLKRPCPEVWPARWAHCASSLANMFPGLTRMALRRHARKDRAMLEK
ncbi:MAG: SDR family NAD(P)-dependent oxidoreductase [Phycisphaerales bacterium]